MRKIRKLIISVLCICIMASFALKIAGFHSYAIKTESMLPTLKVDDMIYAFPVAFESLSVGDVISYATEDGSVITHRITEINDVAQTVITQGDSNKYPDIAAVSESEIIGKVFFKLPQLGKLEFIRNSIDELISKVKGDDLQ